jgi:UDP-N-acetyl-2-amino-2-deoxyglucuronate dehydrogenase
MSPIGYGIIGCGWVLPSHAIAVRSLRDQGVELTAVADIDEGRARRAAEEYGARSWYTDYRELLSRDDIQFVSVCLPHHLHKDITIEAVQRGKHVICEKPLAINVTEADAMLAAARAAGKHLSVIFQHRYDLSFRRLHQAVQQGAFGKILLGQVFHKSTIRANPELASSWREQWATVGGGVLMMQAIHFLDILLWCLGPVESVTANIATLARQEEVEDTGAAVLQFQSGAIGGIASTNASNTDRLTRIEVHGTTGAAVVENDRFVLWQPASDYVEMLMENDDPNLTDEDRRRLLFGTGHVKQIVDFVTRVRNGLAPAVTAEDGRVTTAVMQAIYESSRRGETVSVP